MRYTWNPNTYGHEPENSPSRPNRMQSPRWPSQFVPIAIASHFGRQEGMKTESPFPTMAMFERLESNRSNVSAAPSMVTSQTGTSDSMSSFDRSSFLVVKSTGSSRAAKTPLRKRSGSFGELQPDRQPSQWDFKATFNDTATVEDRNVIMMERYPSLCKLAPKKQLTAKDFMDGSDFLDSTNLFRDSYTSQRWNTDLFEKPSRSFESQKPQEHHVVNDEMDHLFQQLHVSLTQGNTGLPSQQPLHHEDKELDQGTAPTTPTTEPTATPPNSLPSTNDLQKDKQRDKKKKHRKKKSKRRSSRLPSVVPPKEIDVSDCVTVASSIGGGLSPSHQRTSKIPPSLLTLSEENELNLPSNLHRPSNTPAHEVDISAPMTVASSIGQESAWNKPKARRLPKAPKVIDISAQMTVQSSLGGESILRSETRHRKPLNLDKVKSKSVEIDVSDPTVVSSLGESVDYRRRMSYQPLGPERPQDCYYPSLHHQLYASHNR